MSWRKEPARAGLHAVEHPTHATRRLELHPPTGWEPGDKSMPGPWFETWRAIVREPGQPEACGSVLSLMPSAEGSPALLAVEYLRHAGLPILTTAIRRHSDGSETVAPSSQLVESFETGQNTDNNRMQERRRWRLSEERVTRSVGRDDAPVYGLPVYVLEYVERSPIHKGPGPAHKAGLEVAAGLVDARAAELEELARWNREDRTDKLGRKRPNVSLAIDYEARALDLHALAKKIRESESEWEGATGDGFNASAIAGRLA